MFFPLVRKHSQCEILTFKLNLTLKIEVNQPRKQYAMEYRDFTKVFRPFLKIFFHRQSHSMEISFWSHHSCNEVHDRYDILLCIWHERCARSYSHMIPQDEITLNDSGDRVTHTHTGPNWSRLICQILYSLVIVEPNIQIHSVFTQSST